MQAVRVGAAKTDHQHGRLVEVRKKQRQFEIGLAQERRDQVQPEAGQQLAQLHLLRQRQHQAFLQARQAALAHRLQQQAQTQQQFTHRHGERG